MNFPWNGVFDFFTDRGRGALFFRSLAAFFVMFVLGALVDEVITANGWQNDVVYVIPPVGLWLSFWLYVAIRRMRKQRCLRYQSSPLSCDELTKARSKLMKKQAF
jgi:hypothetical protein